MEEPKYLSFHVEGEEITIFGRLQKAKVEYFSEFSDYVINQGLSAMNIVIRLEDVIKFLCVISSKMQQMGTPLAVYTVIDNQKWSLINVEQTIATLLARRKNNLKKKPIMSQSMKVLNCESLETEQVIFIPYCDNWVIKYNQNSQYSRIFEKGAPKPKISFIIPNKDPKAELEISVVNTINEFLNSSEEPKQRKKIR